MSNTQSTHGHDALLIVLYLHLSLGHCTLIYTEKHRQVLLRRCNREKHGACFLINVMPRAHTWHNVHLHFLIVRHPHHIPSLTPPLHSLTDIPTTFPHWHPHYIPSLTYTPTTFPHRYPHWKYHQQHHILQTMWWWWWHPFIHLHLPELGEFRQVMLIKESAKNKVYSSFTLLSFNRSTSKTQSEPTYVVLSNNPCNHYSYKKYFQVQWHEFPINHKLFVHNASRTATDNSMKKQQLKATSTHKSSSLNVCHLPGSKS